MTPAAAEAGLSHLELILARSLAQRAALDWACAAVASRPGDLLEVGLGNGRTYDHMRERLPDRRIWAIERSVAPNPNSRPPETDLLVGDAGDGLARLAGARLALIHVDLGRPGRIAPYATALRDALADGGLLISTDAPPATPGLRAVENAPVDGVGPAERALIHLYERAP